jgi:antitoxin Phd
MTWQPQQAQAHFDEFLDASINEGPQVVVRDGKEMAVLVPMDEWKRLQGVGATSNVANNGTANERVSLKDVLLYGSPGIDDMMIPERGHLLHRDPPEF